MHSADKERESGALDSTEFILFIDRRKHCILLSTSSEQLIPFINAVFLCILLLLEKWVFALFNDAKKYCAAISLLAFVCSLRGTARCGHC